MLRSESAAKIRVNPPTRPKNIRIIRMILEIIPRVGVSPRESPTVPMAELVSKRAIDKRNFFDIANDDSSSEEKCDIHKKNRGCIFDRAVRDSPAKKVG